MFIYDSNREKDQTRKINKFRKRFIILKYYYLLISIFLLIESNAQSLKKLEENTNNEIFIIINKTLSREIINNAFYNEISEIIINENQIINISEVDNIIINSEYELNNITIKFNSKLTSCSYIFSGLYNIIFIDFSNFDSSLVTMMDNMFYGCNSLLSINFNNFNTSSVEDMNNMFSYCK